MAQRNPRGTKLPSRSETARAHGVLLEQLGSQMNVVLEAVTGFERRLDAKIDASEARLSDRISVLEEVVRQNSRDIQKNSEAIQKNSADIQKNSEDIRRHSAEIRSLRDEVAGLRHDFDHRQELGRVDALEVRVSAIESRLGVLSR
jgi:chromosome segregation ATPase